METYTIGDNCICWSFGDRIDLEISNRVLCVYRKIKEALTAGLPGVRDVVPAYTSLAVHFDPVAVTVAELYDSIDPLISEALGAYTGDFDGAFSRKHTVPVTYDGEDLQRVAEVNQLNVVEVVKRHTAARYVVAMIGFLPHFPYLIGLDHRLETPRLDKPRKVVPAGSVAIGGAQTGIYPQESPGGWNIIGSTNTTILSGVQPGDLVQFIEKQEL